MALGAFDFAGDSIGAGIPSGMTAAWGSTGRTNSIVADTDSLGQKAFRIQSDSTSGVHDLIYVSGQSFANGDLLIQAELNSGLTWSDTATGIRLWCRCNETQNAQLPNTGLSLMFRPQHSTDYELTVISYVTGTGTSIPTGERRAVTTDFSKRQFLRFNFNGTAIKFKHWQGTAADEPGAWANQYTFTGCVTAAGRVGLGINMPSGDTLTHWFAWSDDPAVPAALPVIGLSSHTVTSVTDTTATIGITSDSAVGTLYWFVSTSATPPTEAALKAGTGAVAYGNDATPTDGANTAAVTGLAASTTYYRYWFQESTFYKSSISASTSFTTTAGVGEDPALRLDALGSSNALVDTDTGNGRTQASVEYVVLGGNAGSRTITKQGTVAVTSGAMADITDGVSLAGIGNAFKVALIFGNDDQGVYDATVVDRNA